MSITPLNPISPIPFPSTPISNVTPFTYRDGYTYLEVLEKFRDWVNNEIVPTLNADMATVVQEYTTALNALTTEYNAALVAVTAQGDANIDRLQALFNTFVVNITDADMAAAVSGPTKATHGAVSDLATSLIASNAVLKTALDDSTANLVGTPASAIAIAVQALITAHSYVTTSTLSSTVATLETEMANAGRLTTGVVSDSVMPVTSNATTVGSKINASLALAQFGPVHLYVPSTGVAATDTAAFVAAHDALPAGGGVITLDAGPYLVNPDVITFSKPVHIIGQGGSGGATSTAGGYTESALTTIRCASPTGTVFNVTAHACVFEHFHLKNTSPTAPRAGAGIAVTSGGAGTRFNAITVSGFYRNIDIQRGFEWYMSDCAIYDFVKTGLRIQDVTLPDGGDMGIVNCQFMAGPNNLSPQACLEWVSGGGLRVIGCKFNQRGSATALIGIFLHPADNIATSVFTITGNSIENSSYGIYCDDNANVLNNGTITKIAITGNEFDCPTKVIALNRAAVSTLAQVVITGNVFSTPGTAGISLANIDTVVIAANSLVNGLTQPLQIATGVTRLWIDGIACATADRPSPAIMTPGSCYYDTTLGKKGWSNGLAWKDGAGATM